MSWWVSLRAHQRQLLGVVSSHFCAQVPRFLEGNLNAAFWLVRVRVLPFKCIPCSWILRSDWLHRLNVSDKSRHVLEGKFEHDEILIKDDASVMIEFEHVWKRGGFEERQVTSLNMILAGKVQIRCQILIKMFIEWGHYDTIKIVWLNWTLHAFRTMLT